MKWYKLIEFYPILAYLKLKGANIGRQEKALFHVYWEINFELQKIICAEAPLIPNLGFFEVSEAR